MQEEPWFEVQVSILACTRAPRYQGWKAESEGRTPWEGAQVVAFEILTTLCQQHGDSLTNSAAGSIPQVDQAMAVWRQHDRVSMVRDHDERAQSSSPTMSEKFTVMQKFYAREGIRYFWQESYNICVNKLMEAREVQRRLKKRVRKHKKTDREAL